MPYVPVDINSIKLDRAAPSGLVPVDINTIELDSPINAHPYYDPISPANVIPAVVDKLTSPLQNLVAKTYNADKELFTQNFPNASAKIGEVRDRFGAVINKDKQVVGDFIDQHPAAQAIVNSPVAGALKDTAKVASVIPLAGVGGQILNAAEQGLKNTAAVGLKQIPSLDMALGKDLRPGVDELKKASQANYAKAEAAGGNLGASFTNDIIDHAQGFSHKDPMAAAISGPSPIADIVSSLESFRDTPMTLDRAAAVDKALTERLDNSAFTDKNGVLNTHGRQLLEIKNNLRDKLLSAAENGQVQGGAEGVKAYRAAVQDWAAQSQIADIQRIVDRASYMDNSATALKTGFRNIAVNPGRLSKFPKDVQVAIKQAARDGDIANILRTNLGSRLMSSVTGAMAGSVAGPIGSILGGVAGASASGLARNAAEGMQMGRVDNVIDAIAKKSSIPTKRLSLSDILKMPPGEAKKLLARKP